MSLRHYPCDIVHVDDMSRYCDGFSSFNQTTIFGFIHESYSEAERNQITTWERSQQVIREFGGDNRTSRCDTLEAKPGDKEDEFIDKSIKNKSTVPDGGLLQQSWAKRSRSKEDLWDNADEDEGYSRRYLISLKNEEWI